MISGLGGLSRAICLEPPIEVIFNTEAAAPEFRARAAKHIVSR
jgi:hypothetical protein